MDKKGLRRAAAALVALTMLLGLLPAPGAQAADHLRLHYQNAEDNYEDLGVWFWGDVETPSEQSGAWPGGRSLFLPENITDSGAFLDIALSADANQVGVLVVDGAGGKRTPEDLLIDLTSPQMRELWVNDALEVRFEDPRGIPQNHLRVRFLNRTRQYKDMGIWFWGDVANPSEKTGSWPTGATTLTPDDNPLGAYADIELLPGAKQVGFLFVNRLDGTQTTDYSHEPGKAGVVYMREGDDILRLNPYQSQAPAGPEPAVASWQDIDREFATQAPLGAVLKEDGSALLRLWAPTAESVEALLYHPNDQHKPLGEALPMEKRDDGVWEITLNGKNTGLENLKGVFYHFRVTRGGEGRLVLDPYAQSMAAWNSLNERGETVGKAAIVDAASVGPTLTFGEIPGFSDREDAIIYEAHIRDFTAHPGIEEALSAPYGTFSAFVERLDYLKELGVTHIQLLPVLNFYHVNELDRERSAQYTSENENYNWGYDPQSWFALTGMYATNPEDPENRIEEFKQLVARIHDKGMGVILDVVYNHTARVELLEDIEPNYFYFMDKAGLPKGSFGGGQVGSTHLMTRRLILDSLAFLTETYKVDGFRFDMMGSLDSLTIEQAYERVNAINPKALFVGEGWRTYNGDYGVTDVVPADQGWMGQTESVAVFSDEVRNELKSGFGIEGQPRFLTGGRRPLSLVYGNIVARPNNTSEDDPGDIVQYIEAHDNLTLHDVIALSIKKDPALHEQEILRRQRLGNALLLTHQGIIFLHSGQEYGRTKQFLHPDYAAKTEVPPAKSTFMADEEGTPFQHPYFIHDSYDSSDAVNQFDWDKVQNSEPHRQTMEYTRGLVALRRSTDAFSYATAEEVDREIARILSPDIQEVDLVIAFSARSASTGDLYVVIMNADEKPRSLDVSSLGLPMKSLTVLVDAQQAGTEPIAMPSGITLTGDEEGQLGEVTLEGLTAAVLLAKDE